MPMEETMRYSGFSLCDGAAGYTHIETLSHLLRQVEIADQGGMDGWFSPSITITRRTP